MNEVTEAMEQKSYQLAILIMPAEMDMSEAISSHLR